MASRTKSDRPQSWQSTKLWELLNSKIRTDNSLHGALLVSMSVIEEILTKGGTAPLNFTLHDADHAFRVAETMTKIIPPETLRVLSKYDLTLLLLSANLHDIGMTPERGKVQNHYSFLITGNSTGLAEDDIKRFQNWLDDEKHSVTPPLCAGTPTDRELSLAQELVAYYARERHNDWSEEWTRKHFADLTVNPYPGWLDDLVDLCKSHHEGYSELVKDRFNVRIASGTDNVNLRYLAAVLRVADVLEHDPERTPESILRHRQVGPESIVHWYKPHAMSIFVDALQVKVNARPKDARSHKAIIDTIDQIDDELQLCRRLNDEGRFRVGLANDTKRTEWKLPARASLDIQPNSGAYVFIDGSFRPDTEKLLALLGGMELYQGPLAAIRELMSNAFDAVREKIAHIRLRQPNPESDNYENTLGRIESVNLHYEVNSQGAWLVCKDTGVGMSKSIIENYFLVSGRSSRRHLRELERNCNKAGFNFVRSGQFGIGVLSFFMLAEKVVIKTRRCQDCGEGDTAGWRFETDGVGSFGELRTDDTVAPGTEVHLQLRQAALDTTPEKWYLELLDFVRQEIVKIPCTFSISSSFATHPSYSAEPGWRLSESDLVDICFKPVLSRNLRRDVPVELLPKAEKVELEAQQKNWAQLVKDMKAQVKFRRMEGKLENGLGSFRIHIPYFDLAGGLSLVFLRPSSQKGQTFLERLGGIVGYGFAPGGQQTIAWKGINTSRRQRPMSTSTSQTAITEIDFLSKKAGRIAVDRSSLRLFDDGHRALGYIRSARQQEFEKLLDANDESVYSSLNSLDSGVDFPARARLHWFSTSRDSPTANWTPIRFPFTAAGGWINQFTNLILDGTQVSVMTPFPVLSRDFTVRSGRRDYDLGSGTPSMFAYLRTDEMHRPSVVPLWTMPMPGRMPATKKSVFPPEWSRLCAVKLDFTAQSWVWNVNHPLIRLLSMPAIKWCARAFEDNLDYRPVREELLSHQNRGAAWIAHCIRGGLQDLWNAVTGADPEFLRGLWKSVFGSEDAPPIYLWHEHDEILIEIDGTELISMGTDGWRCIPMANESEEAYNRFLPRPSADFCLDADKINFE